MSRTIFVFAGGGTGGHLYPALAVSDELRRRDPDSLSVFACSDRDIDRRILRDVDGAVVPQPVRPFRRNPLAFPGFWRSWKRSIRQCRRMLRDLNPRAVLGLGGFAAGPCVRVASARGIRTGLLNPDAVVGVANRYLSRFGEAIFTQFDSTGQGFPPRFRKKVRRVGCPVRREMFEAKRSEAMDFFDLQADRKTLLVFGGSALAANLTQAVLALGDPWREFAESWQLLMVVGDARVQEARETLTQAGIGAAVLPYCRRMDLAWAAADLALCRGGAITIAELEATKTPAVILPYPHHKDRQQEHNAQPLVARGAARCVGDQCDPAANAATLRAELLPILRDEKTLESMRSAFGDESPHPAADAIADWMMGMESD